MNQSLCARCQVPFPAAQRRYGRILCDNCETAWRSEFDRNLQQRLGRIERPSGECCTSGARPVACE
ncbi:MAG: hypothetical protein ACM3Y9_04195 [Ignavibacteria bacterium]